MLRVRVSARVRVGVRALAWSECDRCLKLGIGLGDSGRVRVRVRASVTVRGSVRALACSECDRCLGLGAG